MIKNHIGVLNNEPLLFNSNLSLRSFSKAINSSLCALSLKCVDFNGFSLINLNSNISSLCEFLKYTKPDIGHETLCCRNDAAKGGEGLG